MSGFNTQKLSTAMDKNAIPKRYDWTNIRAIPRETKTIEGQARHSGKPPTKTNHMSAPPASVVNVTELRTGHRVQPASATTHQSASGFRDAPSRLYLPHSLRLLLPLLELRLRLRLLRILAQVLVIQRGGGHVVMMRTQLDQVSWVGQEGCIEPFAHDTTLRNDVVPLGGLSPAPGDAATTGLLRHPGHDSRRAAWVFNPLQVIGFY